VTNGLAYYSTEIITAVKSFDTRPSTHSLSPWKVKGPECLTRQLSPCFFEDVNFIKLFSFSLIPLTHTPECLPLKVFSRKSHTSL
jgi:hypothetical protein